MATLAVVDLITCRRSQQQMDPIIDTLTFPDMRGRTEGVRCAASLNFYNERGIRTTDMRTQRDQRPADKDVEGVLVSAAVTEPKRRVPPPAVGALGHW